MMKRWMVFFVLACACLAAGRAQAAPDRVCADEFSFTREAYRRIAARQTDFELGYSGALDAFYDADLQELFEAVWEIDRRTSDDFDYLLHSVADFRATNRLEGGSAVFSFHLDYLESAEELAAVNRAVAVALAKLDLQDDSDGVKIRKLHDYVVLRMARGERDTVGSAYGAMVKRRASPRGAALLMYKLLTEAKLPCRIVRGAANGAALYWNMVKLEDRWYYLDAAADAGIGPAAPVRYAYFLVGSNFLRGKRQLAEPYRMAEFEANYPVSAADYAERNQLILAADADRQKAAAGVGAFDEAYDQLSRYTVDAFERLNDTLANGALDALEGVFSGG